MWVPSKVIELIGFVKDNVEDIRKENVALKTENTLLKSQLAVTQTNFDWLRIKVNQLELHNTALLEKAYNIRVPTPELARQPAIDPNFDPRTFSGFDDIGDELARKLGMPVYDDK